MWGMQKIKRKAIVIIPHREEYLFVLNKRKPTKMPHSLKKASTSPGKGKSAMVIRYVDINPMMLEMKSCHGFMDEKRLYKK